MSDKKKFNNYKNIDFEDTYEDDDITDFNSNIKEQHTLDYYNDDMSRKAVKSIFEINNEPEDNFVEESYSKPKKTYGYDGTNKHNTYTPEQLNKTDQNGNPEYTMQSFDYDKLNQDVKNGYRYSGSQKEPKKRYDYRNTSFNQDKIKSERKDREELEKNKKILKKFEEEERQRQNDNNTLQNFKTVNDFQDSINDERHTHPRRHVSSKKRQQIMIFRICTTSFIIIILSCLFINIYSNVKLKSEVTRLTTENDRLAQENLEVQALTNEISILNDELAKLRTETADLDTTNSSSNESSDNSNEVSEYIVQSGDTLSSISKSVYGDPNRYNEIYDANNLTTTDLVSGQKLLIP